MIIYSVLNPSIRLSWIHKHWDRQYIASAEKTIRETVRYCHVILQTTLISNYQMSEYRVTTAEMPLAGSIAPPCLGDTPAYMSLDAQYGFLDDDLEIGSITTPEQTVEQEFQAYITSKLSRIDIDILKFWEASRELISSVAN
jgi:hypothetical protein